MPFQKGQSGNKAGRPKGALNKATREMKDIALELTINSKEYMERLKRRLLSGKLHPSVETFILAHAVGKPKDTLSIENAPPVLVVDELTPEDIQKIQAARE